MAPLNPVVSAVVAGAIAGGVELVIMYPLDVVKTRFMANAGKDSAGIIGTLSKIVKEEGWARLYRGIAAPLMVEPVKRAVKFSTQSFYASLAPAGLLGQFISGALAGTTEVIIIAPTEIVKVRLQSKDFLGKYTGSTMQCIAKIYKEEGALAFLKGLEAGIWRQALYNGSLFGWSALFKSLWAAPIGYGANLWRNFVCGAVAGTLGVSLNNVFDVICTRNRNMPPGKPAIWAWLYLFKIVREEGVGALYKGYVAKVSRLGPGGGIMLMVVDAVTILLKKLFVGPAGIAA